jgi:RNA polymerase sigma-70 factor (ECF subfamily)
MTNQSRRGHRRPDPALSVIMSERRQLIDLAYRLLGSLPEVEDAVRDTDTRWYAMTRRRQPAIESPGAWLVTGRICLNLLGSTRTRRETDVSRWIPEPLPERTRGSASGRAPPADPADQVTPAQPA